MTYDIVKKFCSKSRNHQNFKHFLYNLLKWRKNNKKDQNQNQLNRSESHSLLSKDSVSQESPAQRNHKLCTQTMKKMTMAGPRPNPGILGQILGHTQAGKT